MIRLGVLTLLVIAAPFALHLLHRAGTTLGEVGRRSAALLVMALFVFGLPFTASGFSGIAAAEAFGLAIVAVLAIWLTYLGLGSIALWAFRFASVQVGALGTLMSRGLPLARTPLTGAGSDVRLYWAVDVLQAGGARVHLAHPLGVKGFRYR